jgi:hypothetical protein
MLAMNERSYSELCRRNSFSERFEYLNLSASVGVSTFGFDRHINQAFYTSYEWKQVRLSVILRDSGCDLGVPGHEINGALLVHHMNPMTVDDVLNGVDWILDAEYLITTTKDTHNAIHFGSASQLRTPYVPRSRGDTKLW